MPLIVLKFFDGQFGRVKKSRDSPDKGLNDDSHREHMSPFSVFKWQRSHKDHCIQGMARGENGLRHLSINQYRQFAESCMHDHSLTFWNKPTQVSKYPSSDLEWSMSLQWSGSKHCLFARHYFIEQLPCLKPPSLPFFQPLQSYLLRAK